MWNPQTAHIRSIFPFHFLYLFTKCKCIYIQTAQLLEELSGHEAPISSLAFGTDAGLFAEHDLPGIVVGPGSIREAHTSREFVEIRQVENATAFFQALFEASVPRA